jgi:hypothetical protein
MARMSSGHWTKGMFGWSCIQALPIRHVTVTINAFNVKKIIPDTTFTDATDMIFPAIHILHFSFCIFTFGVWGLGFGVWGLGFGVWGLGFLDSFVVKW